jgi:UDP-N-acetylglucosamine 4,6-dehydratase/5-epimerase
MVTYSIGEMAEKLGKSIKTLQNWDKSGVLKAFRTPTNRRYYSQDQFLEMSGKEKYKRVANSELDAIADKVILITGGTGSLGNALTRRICDNAKKVIIYSRCELKQANMQQNFRDKKNIRYMIGNICDKERLIMALRGVDVCIHAACMKRVETCTYNPLEAVKNNIVGSMNVLEACISNKVPKSLLVSSDKACASATLYGGTKFIAEQIFINGNNYSTRDCIFTATRYGNVFGSNGSIRYLFEKQFKENGKVDITHKDMTRFFMSMDDAVDLNLFALNNALGGEIFIPKLKSTTIMSFAETFIPDAPTKIIGIRGGEKIHEDLISDTEMMYTVDCGKYYKIVPPGVSDSRFGWDREYPYEARVKPFKYSSDSVERLTQEELKKLDI